MWEASAQQSCFLVSESHSQITGQSDRNSAQFQLPVSEGYSSALQQQLSIWQKMLLLIMHCSLGATQQDLYFLHSY